MNAPRVASARAPSFDVRRAFRRARVVAAVAIAAAVIGFFAYARAFLVAYLVAWMFWMGSAIGATANVWVQTLTGGRWGDAVRPRLLDFGRTVPFAAIAFLPVLLGMHELYPWATDAARENFAAQMTAPHFKQAWLDPVFWAIRSVAYLVLWSLLAWLTPRLARSVPFACLAFLAYAFSMTLAAVDWIASLMPVWYSTNFGLLVGCGQMLGGSCIGVVAAALAPETPGRLVFRDFGNLLLMYVLSWAYLAFTGYLIIWAENLPAEIGWYVARVQTAWRPLGLVLIVCNFAAPLVLLLFRDIKDVPHRLGLLAAALLVLHLVDVVWLIVPSVPLTAGAAWIVGAGCVAALALVTSWLMYREAVDPQVPPVTREELHGA